MVTLGKHGTIHTGGWRSARLHQEDAVKNPVHGNRPDPKEPATAVIRDCQTEPAFGDAAQLPF